MNHHKEGKKKSEQPKNKMGMEGRIPTMPNVYNGNFKILRTYGRQQVKTSRAEYISHRPVVCLQCGHNFLKCYDHYSRKAAFINEKGVRKTFLIKAKYYKCQHCSFLFLEPIEGLLTKKRISEQCRKPIDPEYIKNVNNKIIAHEFGVSQSSVERIIHERFQLKSMKP